VRGHDIIIWLPRTARDTAKSMDTFPQTNRIIKASSQFYNYPAHADWMFGCVGERDTCKSTCLHTCEPEAFDVIWRMSALWCREGDWKSSLPWLHQFSPLHTSILYVWEKHSLACPHVC